MFFDDHNPPHFHTPSAVRSWEALPDLALLAIKWHMGKGKPHWHWVVFVREEGRARVLDSNRSLRRNVRTDFRRMKPKWFIPVFGTKKALED